MTKPSFVNRSVISLSCVFAAAACSSDGSDSSMANASPGAPSTEMMAEPTAPPAMAEPPGDQMPAPGSMEGSPLGADLTQPAGESNAPGAGAMPPSDETPPEPEAPTPVEPGAAVPSAGCGSAAVAASGRITIDVAGASRDYILALPENYDATRPYRLVFTWHPGGGSAQGTANNFYGLRQLADDSAIFVSPEGIDQGWANTNGRDIAFLDAMLDRFQGELCFDQSRVFSTGFSYGGMMSLAIGCGRADVFRAIAPMSGALFSGCEDGDEPIAMLGFHGTTDTVVDIAQGVRARDVIVERNGCQAADQAVETNGCLAFQGCSEGNSVTWCEFNGGHTPAPQSGQRIWDFFSQF
jgi:poly(3-hydroxybutyrate) depolymerase